jgi:hypothetical protein
MTWPQPTREDHERFCKNEGWRRLRDARGRTGTHHITYELDLPDGGVLRTRISHPPDRTTYGPSLWAHILRDQLRVSDEEFWACVREGRRPGRGERPMPSDALPADLVHLLIHRVGLTDTEVAGMSKDEAVDRLRRFWSGD